MSHTILFVQPGRKLKTRTYSEFESVEECMVAVCKFFEEHLMQLNPHNPRITYNLEQLFDFIDHQLIDLSCVVYQRRTNTYSPHNKEWIKEKIYFLNKQ